MKTFLFSARPFLSADFEGAGGAVETNPSDDGLSAGSEVSDAPDHDEANGDGAEGEGAQLGQPNPEEDDAEDLEWEGKKFRAPKGLQSALMMHADYTRKTQEVAQHRQALEAERQTLAQQAQAERANIREVAQLHRVDETLEQYKNVDWAALQREDPDAAQTHWRQYQTLKDQRAELAGAISEKVQQQGLEAQQSYAKRVQEAMAAIADPKTGIKGWGPELARQMTEYGAKAGLTDADFRGINADPRAMKVLHKAMLWDRHEAKQAAAAKPPAKPVAQPVTTVGKGTTPIAKDPSKMSDAEWWEQRRLKELKRK